MVPYHFAWFCSCRLGAFIREYVYFLVIRQVIEETFRYLGFGEGAFLLLYFGGMVVASASDVIRYRNAAWYTSIGASGAVSAVLFTAIFLNPWDKILLFA